MTPHLYYYNAEGYRGPNGRNIRTVWDIKTQAYKEAHFVTFPPGLIDPCVRLGSRPGDLVLEPFFGAGTTGVVARGNGRRFVGIELNPDYVRIAEKRLAKLKRESPTTNAWFDITQVLAHEG